jgi:hypothetical protein
MLPVPGSPGETGKSHQHIKKEISMANQLGDSNDNDMLLTRILQRSANDREFRTRLVVRPESAIEEMIGVRVANLPRPVRVRFVEKDAELDALVVLPDFVDPEGELTDAELEAVAGGSEWCITSCTFTITVCYRSCDEGFCGSGGGSSW